MTLQMASWVEVERTREAWPARGSAGPEPSVSGRPGIVGVVGVSGIVFTCLLAFGDRLLVMVPGRAPRQAVARRRIHRGFGRP